MTHGEIRALIIRFLSLPESRRHAITIQLDAEPSWDPIAILYSIWDNDRLEELEEAVSHEWMIIQKVKTVQ
jgi:hypothetical protein